MKVLQIVSSVWFGVLFMHCLFSYEIQIALWILDLPVVAFLGLAGLALAVVWAVVACRKPQPLRSVLLCAACLIATGVFLFTPYGTLLGTYFRFYRHLEHYEAVVAQISQADIGTLTERQQSQEYIIDKGPPVRIAFVWHVMIDNWIGIVYDPSGEVMRANVFKRDWSNWKDPQLRPVKALFGGDLYMTRKLWKDWYCCWFT
jgi:hypothetical protein